jgi:hypothetical protein
MYFYINPRSDCGHIDRISIAQYENYRRSYVSAAAGAEWGVSPWKQIRDAPLNTACYVRGKSDWQPLNVSQIKQNSLRPLNSFETLEENIMI